MLTQAFWTSLRILVFRAGPEDFPYDPGPTLGRVCLLAALAAFAALFGLMIPPFAAVAFAALTILALWLVSRSVLRMRGLENRLQQTFNALLLTNAVLTLLMLPPFARIAPLFLDFYQQLRQHPELANQPQNWPQPAAGPSFVFDLLGLWQFVVCARIFGHGASVGPLGGLGLMLLCMALSFVLALLASPLIGALLT